MKSSTAIVLFIPFLVVCLIGVVCALAGWRWLENKCLAALDAMEKTI